MTQQIKHLDTQPIVKPMSKRELAKRVLDIVTSRASYTRADIIESFMTICSMSKNGANTYYYNFTSGPWK